MVREGRGRRAVGLSRASKSSDTKSNADTKSSAAVEVLKA